MTAKTQDLLLTLAKTVSALTDEYEVGLEQLERRRERMSADLSKFFALIRAEINEFEATMKAELEAKIEIDAMKGFAATTAQKKTNESFSTVLGNGVAHRH